MAMQRIDRLAKIRTCADLDDEMKELADGESEGGRVACSCFSQYASLCWYGVCGEREHGVRVRVRVRVREGVEGAEKGKSASGADVGLVLAHTHTPRKSLSSTRHALTNTEREGTRPHMYVQWCGRGHRAEIHLCGLGMAMTAVSLARRCTEAKQ